MRAGRSPGGKPHSLNQPRGRTPSSPQILNPIRHWPSLRADGCGVRSAPRLLPSRARNRSQRHPRQTGAARRPAEELGQCVARTIVYRTRPRFCMAPASALLTGKSLPSRQAHRLHSLRQTRAFSTTSAGSYPPAAALAPRWNTNRGYSCGNATYRRASHARLRDEPAPW